MAGSQNDYSGLDKPGMEELVAQANKMPFKAMDTGHAKPAHALAVEPADSKKAHVDKSVCKKTPGMCAP